MRKIDVALVALAVVAVVVTAGVATRSADLTGERTFEFASATTPLSAQGPTDAASPGATFLWQAPRNSTAASFTVNVTFSGMAVRGGSATISARIIGPDGTVFPGTTHPMMIAQGGSAANATLHLGAQWTLAPEPQRDDRGGNATIDWSEPLQVLITVEAPSDLPVARYGFEAQAAGIATTFYAK